MYLCQDTFLIGGSSGESLQLEDLVCMDKKIKGFPWGEKTKEYVMLADDNGSIGKPMDD